MAEIKWKLRPKLEAHAYYIWPTPIKAIRTAKAGWLFLAHPNLTHRNDIWTTLAPLIEQHTGKRIEFQAVPEIETIETPTNKVQQRVLVLRVPQEECNTMKIFFTQAFADDSTFNIAYLARYTFVPSQTLGDCTKSHLQQLLYRQKQFHKSI